MIRCLVKNEVERLCDDLPNTDLSFIRSLRPRERSFALASLIQCCCPDDAADFEMPDEQCKACGTCDAGLEDLCGKAARGEDLSFVACLPAAERDLALARLIQCCGCCDKETELPDGTYCYRWGSWSSTEGHPQNFLIASGPNAGTIPNWGDLQITRFMGFDLPSPVPIRTDFSNYLEDVQNELRSIGVPATGYFTSIGGGPAGVTLYNWTGIIKPLDMALIPDPWGSGTMPVPGYPTEPFDAKFETLSGEAVTFEWGGVQNMPFEGSSIGTTSFTKSGGQWTSDETGFLDFGAYAAPSPILDDPAYQVPCS